MKCTMKIVWQFRHVNIKKLVAVCLSTLLQNLCNNNNNNYNNNYNKERPAAATGLQQFWTLCTDWYLYQRWLKCKECLKWTASLMSQFSTIVCLVVSWIMLFIMQWPGLQDQFYSRPTPWENDELWIIIINTISII